MQRLDRQMQHQLLELVRCGDAAERERALALLLEDFRGPAMAAVYKALASCGVDAVHAEEALQEATLKFISVGVTAFKGEASPRTYFVRIALNAALDTARRLARTRGLDQLDPGTQERVASAEEGLCAAEIRRALRHCIDLLPEPYRDSVRLYYLEEAGDCSTCGERVGTSKDAFMQRLCRARLMLADCIRRRTR
jgi:RNA polymerase sigma factor (sigma-70 family)